MGFKFRSVGKKLKAIVQDPGAASRVVAKTAASVATGKKAQRHTISAETLAKPVTLGKAIAAPVALLAGSAAGTVSGVAASVLPERAAKVATEHPFATTGALALAVAAPGAVILGASKVASSATRVPSVNANGATTGVLPQSPSELRGGTSPVGSGKGKRTNKKRPSKHRRRNRRATKARRKHPRKAKRSVVKRKRRSSGRKRARRRASKRGR